MTVWSEQLYSKSRSIILQNNFSSNQVVLKKKQVKPQLNTLISKANYWHRNKFWSIEYQSHSLTNNILQRKYPILNT